MINPISSLTIRKGLLVTGLGLLASCSGTQEINRAKKPEPGKAPDIEVADYESFTLDNGMQVFVVEDPNMPSVTFNMDVNRPPIRSGKKSGYTQLAGQVLGTATENRSKDELNEAIDFIGASLSTSSTGFYASALKKHHEKLLQLSADVIKNPVFKQEEFEKQQKQLISSVKSSENSPGAIAGRVYNRLLFGKDHPYGDIRSVETVENVSLDDVKNYYQQYFDPSISYLAVVGNVTKEEIKPLVKEEFGDWKSDGQPPEKDYETPEPAEERKVAVVNRSAAEQSTLRIGHPVDLQLNDSAYFAARLANTILGSPNFRLFMNLREDKAYTYGAYSSIDADEEVGSFTASAEVSNDATDSAVKEVLKEMRQIRSEGVTADELERAKSYITGNFAIGLEDARTVARYALNIAQNDLPEDYYQNYLKNLNAVKQPAVQRAAQNYINPERAQVLVVGKAEAFEGKLDKFGPVDYYTKFGKPTKSPSAKMSSADMTAAQVIDKYVKAIGGADKLKEVTSMQKTYEATIQGRKLKMKQELMSPDMYRQVMEVGGMKQQEQIYNGEKAVMKSPRAGEREITGDAKARMAVFSQLFYHAHLDEMDVEAEMQGVTSINGQQAYEITMTTGNGTSWTEFFSKDDYMQIGRRQTVQTGRGERETTTYFSNYQEKKGIMIPHTMTQSMGPRQFDLKLQELAINPELSKDKFMSQ
jgi:predicted Zn-dependent peptidase